MIGEYSAIPPSVFDDARKSLISGTENAMFSRPGPVGRLAQVHEAVAVLVRQRTQHHAAHDAEDRRVGADAESEREDHGEGEAPRPGQAAQREAKIRHEHGSSPVEVSRAYLNFTFAISAFGVKPSPKSSMSISLRISTTPLFGDMCTRGGKKSWSSSPPSRCSFEHVVEAGVAMLHAVGHARGDGVITRFLRRERQIADERRDAVLLTEFK